MHHGFMGGFNQPSPPSPEGESRQFEPGQDEHMTFNEKKIFHDIPYHA